MKKITAILVVTAVVLLSFGGCSDDKAVRQSASDYAVSLFADKAEVSPGESVTVTLHMKNCKRVASFDVLMTSSDNVAADKYSEKDVGDFIANCQERSDGIVFGAFVATTCDIDDSDFCYVTYTVDENASSGDKVTFDACFSSFYIGVDETGNETEKITDSIKIAPVTVNVK